MGLTAHADATTSGVLTDSQRQLVSDHLPLLRHIVASVSAGMPRHVDRDELFNAGAVGLVDAASRYDPAGGATFATYASTRMRGAIVDSLRRSDWLPRNIRQQIRQIRKAEDALSNTYGSDIPDAVLADAVGMSVEQLREHRSAASDASVVGLDQERKANLLADPDSSTNPEESLETAETRQHLQVAVRHLPDPHRTVLERYYFQGDLLQNIAADLDLTEVRISQLRKEALQHVQSALSELWGPESGVPTVPDAAPGKRRRTRYLEVVSSALTSGPRREGKEQP